MSYRNIKDASIDSKTGLPVYGMDAELAAKQAGKYDAGKEKEVRDWLKAVTGESVTGDFHEALKNGVILCKLANKLVPNSVPKINGANTMPFMQMENINNFLNAIENKVGLPKHNSFRTVDLYENKNIVSVIDCLYMLGSYAQKLPNYHGPTLGVKLAEKKEIQFSEDQLRKAKAQPTFMAEASLKGEAQKSIKNEVVKVKDTGDKAAVSQLSQASLKGESQKSIKHEVVKVKDTGDKAAVSQLSQASLKGDSQKSIKHEVVKTQQYGSVAETLAQLDSLYKSGILTEAEYRKKREQVLQQ